MSKDKNAPHGLTLNDALRKITVEFCKDLPRILSCEELEKYEMQLLTMVQDRIRLMNTTREKGQQIRLPNNLSHMQVATIINATQYVCRVPAAGQELDAASDLLMLYQADPNDLNYGIHIQAEDALKPFFRALNYSADKRFHAQVLDDLLEIAPRKMRCKDRDLVAVNNGIFNYQTKQLQDFEPKLVFLSKSRVNYKPNATNPVIQHPVDGSIWDVENWVHELTDDPEITQLIWEILGAIIRPHVRWSKSAWLYSESGNNGKGSLCELMRQLCGAGTFASIPIADFSKRFALEPLLHSSAIIVDENSVGTYVDGAANLKTVITNDVLYIDRKYLKPVSYQFWGFVVQCLNEFPKFKDKSESMYRRQLFVPFNKCFTGAERKYIKNDYLQRQDVLEYVLYKVLNMDYYELSEPSACKAVLAEYKEYNDPVRAFFAEFSSVLTWDLVPFSFLYDLFKAWSLRSNPAGKICSRSAFINSLLSILPDFPIWYCKGKNVAVRRYHAVTT